MDGDRFDYLSRRLGSFRTRRQALKAVAGAAAAAVVGGRSAAAQECTPHYQSCQSDGQCCDGAVCQYGMCMPGCRIDGAFVNAGMFPTGDICQQCLPEVSTTAWSPANEGMACWSGDMAAGVTTCRNGTCRGDGCTSNADCRTDEACTDGVCVDRLPCPYYEFDEPVCFWLNCRDYGGYENLGCCPEPQPQHATYDSCRAQDSCNGGGGVSNGGCYKWAQTSDTRIAPPW